MQASNKVGFVATTALRLPVGQAGPDPPPASFPKRVTHRPDRRGCWARPGRSRLVCWRAAQRGRQFRRGGGLARGGAAAGGQRCWGLGGAPARGLGQRGVVAAPGRPMLPAQQVSIAKGALKPNLKEIVPLTAHYRLYVMQESVF
jgi:hypothetical protein